jgi:PilZ domain
MSDSASTSTQEKRKYERISLSLKGQLFDPGDETEISCELVNLSAGGAALKTDSELPAGKHMVVYIEGFGRYEGTVVVHGNGTLALHFTIGELKRKRLAEMLHQFVSRGLPGITELRRFERTASSSSGEIVLENGNRLTCDILDISLDGASLKTDGRPEIGEVVALGRSLGRVVRHHRHGIAIQYVKEVPAAN